MTKDKLKLLPLKPGCYLMKDINNNIIYVGKAKDLKKRVSSYFNKIQTGKTRLLVDNINDFEYIVTTNELESLLLEINLIKKYNPKYNILLKDDKTYPYIKLTNDKYPRLLIIRTKNKNSKSGTLFGPYPNANAARSIVYMLNRLYPLRKCEIMPKDTCLYYHINECLGYCINKIDNNILNNMLKEIVSFLKGNDDIIKNKIKYEMKEASSKLNYEKAKELRDMLINIDKVLEKQLIDINDNINRDIFGYYLKDDYISIQVFSIRNGRVIQRIGNIFDKIGDEKDNIIYYIMNYYDNNIKPKEILLSNNLDIKLLSDALNVKVIIPQKGIKKRLLDMVNDNAKIALEEKINLLTNNKDLLAINQLQDILNIKFINRIEVFDNAHLFGTYTVSSMVVFINGKKSTKDYRKYKLSIDSKDDYASLKEVLYRRYYRLLEEKQDKPDLILVDGGENQVKVAKQVLDDFNLDIPVYGLKKNNKHKTTSLVNDINEIKLDRKSNAFYLLEKIQNEVHRFTINYHKQIRSKGALSGALDNIKGLGKIRKDKLIEKYKTINNIKNADINELKKIIPEDVISQIKNL